MSTHARAIALRSAVMAMALRHAAAERAYAYAVADRTHADERERLFRACSRRFAALQRLTHALADLAGGIR